MHQENAREHRSDDLYMRVNPPTARREAAPQTDQGKTWKSVAKGAVAKVFACGVPSATREANLGLSTGLRQPGPAAQALQDHIENRMAVDSDKLQALRAEALQTFQGGASSVVLDTEFLFPHRLCKAAWKEMSRESTDAIFEERSDCATAWNAWVEGVAQGLGMHLDPTRRSKIRCDSASATPFWHVDGTKISATVALRGIGTEYVLGGEDSYLNPTEPTEIAPRGHTLIFYGKEHERPLWHRTPDTRQNKPRLLFVC